MSGKYPYVLTKGGRDQHFRLTPTQIDSPTTRGGIIFWAIANVFGPWVLLPEDIPYDAVLTVSRKSLIEGRKVMMNVVGMRDMQYVVRQPDLVLAISVSNAKYFDTPHSLLASITCSLKGCVAPVELSFDEPQVCSVLDNSGLDTQTRAFLKRLLKGHRVPLGNIERQIQKITNASRDPRLTTAVLGHILEMSALPSASTCN